MKAKSVIKYLLVVGCVLTDGIRGYANVVMEYLLSRPITEHEWYRHYDIWTSIAFLFYCFTVLYLLYLTKENLADYILIAVWFGAWCAAALIDTWQEILGVNDRLEKNELPILAVTTIVMVVFAIILYKKPTHDTATKTGDKR